jgi:hypothetical protein
MIFRHAGEEPQQRRNRPSPSFLVSVGVHVVVAIALMRMLIVNMELASSSQRRSTTVERVSYVTLGTPGTKAVTPGRSGGDGRPIQSREIRVVPPRAVPEGIPAPAAATKPEAEGGTGPLVGTGGPARGIRPSYSDPRLWAPPQKIIAPPPTVAETIEGLIAEGIRPYNDSVARAAGRRDPTDWTMEKGGYKWGIDKRAIRLGPVSIPTALLALLPLNLQGNPITMDRDRAYNAMHRDIQWHAQQGVNEADFAKAVRSIRERKERERAAALAVLGEPSKDQPQR